jgi:hypothetical protein
VRGAPVTGKRRRGTAQNLPPRPQLAEEGHGAEPASSPVVTLARFGGGARTLSLSFDSFDCERTGLKCGLEIHYQLDTRTKLFCRCPVGLRNNPHDAVIVSHMRFTRSEIADDRHIVLKMSSGYKEARYKIPESQFPVDEGKPSVTLLGTGGTIASRLDYRTGAVIPAFSPGELYGAVPELADNCNLKTEKLFGIFSENMGPEQWIATARAIGREIENGTDTMHHTADREAALDTAFEEKVSIVYYYPNMQPDIIEALVDHGYRGIVIAGTGLGHVNKPLYEPLRKAVQKGVAVYMTVQTLWGYVHMYVYDTGRDLMDIGVVPAANMLPEVAYMKLCWVLGHTREPPNGYIVLQGGIPEVEDFIGRQFL